MMHGRRSTAGAGGLSRRAFLASSALAVATGALHPLSLRAAPSRSASGSEWPHHGWDLEQTRWNRNEKALGPEEAARLALRWEFEAGSGITGTPAVTGDRVVVGSWDGFVYALDRKTGKLAWKHEVGTRDYPPDRTLGVYASAAIDGNRVIVAADRLVGLDLESGERLWETVVGDPAKTLEYFWASPLAHDGAVYAGVSAGSETKSRGQLVRVDAATGEVAWSFFTVAEEVAGGSLIAPPSLEPEAGLLYASTGNPFNFAVPGPLPYTNSLLALDPETGDLRWADQVHPRDEKNLDLNCPPMLLSVEGDGEARRIAVVAGKDGIRAWDRTEKTRLWHLQLTPPVSVGEDEALPTNGPEAGPTAAADGTVFFASNNQDEQTCLLAAIDAATGTLLWLRTLPDYQYAPMSVANGVVYMGLGDGKLRAWRAKDGELLWESPAGDPIAGGPAVAGGMVFVGTGAGMFLPGRKLLAFAPE